MRFSSARRPLSRGLSVEHLMDAPCLVGGCVRSHSVSPLGRQHARAAGILDRQRPEEPDESPAVEGHDARAAIREPLDLRRQLLGRAAALRERGHLASKLVKALADQARRRLSMIHGKGHNGDRHISSLF